MDQDFIAEAYDDDDSDSDASDDDNDDTSDFHEDHDDEAVTRSYRPPIKRSNQPVDNFIESADLAAPLKTIVDMAEERKLEQKLVLLQNKMAEEAKRLKNLVSSDRKRKRNRMASQISRLRKKLLVFELQRRYLAIVDENKALKSANDGLHSTVQQLQAKLAALGV